MALSRRTGARFQASIWPGFVDAMTGLLLVLMFVLTIFMVLQFVLQERITGQENELTELSAEVAALTQALGLTPDPNTTLGAQVGVVSAQVTLLQGELRDSESVVDRQNALITQLTNERDMLSNDLSDATSRITGFEAQVAGLLAQRRQADALIADLEGREAVLLSGQEALNLALAQARDEIDARTEAARLAAARREALEAMIAELETQGNAAQTQISELEAQALVDTAAAEALRARLENADTELTAMTLALEEQRQQAEDTLTLLAAARAARDDLDQNLAIALLAQQEAAQDRVDLQDQLAQALIARTQLEAEVDAQTASRTALADELAAAVAALAAAQAQNGTTFGDLDSQTALLAAANAALAEQEALSAQGQRQVALLNEQVAALRAELGRLQTLLDLENEADAAANVQIETLTQDLNTAMARALLAERRANALEEAEVVRLAAEAEELERYRSDFLGLLRGVLEGVDGVRIEGDRFVFSSEVLFEQGAAELSAEGQDEIAKVAGILRDVADDIPDGIDWVIRVDGHTDNVPLSGFGEFANNWELSQARALSVVLYMVEALGIPPDRLAANGFGQYQPINPADTDVARAQNRRIELKLTEQ